MHTVIYCYLRLQYSAFKAFYFVVLMKQIMNHYYNLKTRFSNATINTRINSFKSDVIEIQMKQLHTPNFTTKYKGNMKLINIKQ